MADARPPTREDRLKAALRDNLRRRKAQARGRTDEPAKDGSPAPPDAKSGESS